MATIFDNKPQTAYVPVREDEALQHNAQIKERYRQLLQSAEENQLSESISRAERASYAPRASVLAPERPEEREPYFAPAPESPAEHVSVHTRVDSPLFTPETLDRTIRESGYAGAEESAYASVAVPEAELRTADMPAYGGAQIGEMPVTAVNAETKPAESYGLSAFAIRIIAAFAAAVILLLSVIGINSYVISQKTRQLRSLEQRRQQLAEENAELEARIEEATSYDKVLEFVRENGMILADE